MRHLSILTAALTALAAPLAAQETAGMMTVTLGSEERTFVVVQGDATPTSSFRREGGEIVVNLVARPDRAPDESGALIELDFAVTGMGPTAEPNDTHLRYTTAEGDTLATEEGSAEVTMTSFGIQDEVLTVSGNLSSPLHAEEGGDPATAIIGDFQATLRQEDPS